MCAFNIDCVPRINFGCVRERARRQKLARTILMRAPIGAGGVLFCWPSTGSSTLHNRRRRPCHCQCQRIIDGGGGRQHTLTDITNSHVRHMPHAANGFDLQTHIFIPNVRKPRVTRALAETAAEMSSLLDLRRVFNTVEFRGFSVVCGGVAERLFRTSIVIDCGRT